MTDTIDIGLDFETSGLSIRAGHVPLTLGLAWKHEPIGQETEIKTAEFSFHIPGTWDIEAMRVNKLTPPIYPYSTEDVIGVATSHDGILCEFLVRQFGEPEKQLRPVGWNVGVFDMAFFNFFFPQAAKWFTHRPLELNSLVYACGIATGKPDLDWKGWIKDQLNANYQAEWHKAEWDAKASLLAKDYLDDVLHDVHEGVI